MHMARYIDNGSGKSNQDVGHWLDKNLVAGIRAFRGQFGYFRFNAIEAFADLVRDAAVAGKPVHFVLGSNFGSLVAEDAQLVLRVASGEQASLTVVAFADAEFHPKTIHIVRADGSATAVVGSSNLTGRGLGQNVEASVIFDSTAGDDPAQLAAIASAIDRWRTLGKNSAVFRITSDASLRKLAEDKIINLPQPKKRWRAAPRGRNGGGAKLPRRIPTWSPSRRGWRPDVPDLIPRPAEMDEAPEMPPVAPDPATPAPPSAPVLRLIWESRGLTERDLTIPTGTTTHATGSMLWKRGARAVDQRHWFRDVAFAGLDWQPDPESAHLERAGARFTLVIQGRTVGAFDLRLTHNTNTLSKAYAQRNSMTQVHWGAAKRHIAQRRLLRRTMSLFRRDSDPPEFQIVIE